MVLHPFQAGHYFPYSLPKLLEKLLLRGLLSSHLVGLPSTKFSMVWSSCLPWVTHWSCCTIDSSDGPSGSGGAWPTPVHPLVTRIFIVTRLSFAHYWKNPKPFLLQLVLNIKYEHCTMEHMFAKAHLTIHTFFKHWELWLIDPRCTLPHWFLHSHIISYPSQYLYDLRILPPEESSVILFQCTQRTIPCSSHSLYTC